MANVALALAPFCGGSATDALAWSKVFAVRSSAFMHGDAVNIFHKSGIMTLIDRSYPKIPSRQPPFNGSAGRNGNLGRTPQV